MGFELTFPYLILIIFKYLIIKKNESFEIFKVHYENTCHENLSIPLFVASGFILDKVISEHIVSNVKKLNILQPHI